MHLGLHKRSRLHSPHEDLQQGRVELRSGRGSRADRWPPGRLCRLPEPAPAADIPAPRCAGQRMHPYRGLSLRLQWVGPLDRNCYRGGGRGLGFGIPPRSAGRRPLRGPATGQAVGEPGRLPRPVSCAGRPTTGHDLRRLVCAHNNGQGLGSPGPPHQGKRRRVLGTSSEWAAADFGFRACPIFRVDILAADEEGVELGPLRCYTKDADASTILAASKRATQLHPDGPNPETLLPSSAAVSWVWRTAKCHAVGKDVSAFHLHEVPEIAEGRTISTLSTRNREKRLQEIRGAASAEDWRQRAWKWLEAERQLHEEEQRRRAEELDRIAQLVAAGRQYGEKSRETARDVGTALGVGGTEKVADLAAGRKWVVLEFRRAAQQGADAQQGASAQQEADAQPWRKNPRVVLRGAVDPDTVVVWATKGLGAILDGCADLFESKTDNRHGRTTYWLPPAGRFARLEIEIEPTRVFQSRDGRQISWNPIRVVAAPDPQRLAALQALAEKEQEYKEAEQRAILLEAPVPKPMDTTKAIDLPPGEYICRRYAPNSPIPSAHRRERRAHDRHRNTDIRRLPRERGRNTGRSRGVAEGARTPALQPGRGADNAAKEKRPPGLCRCGVGAR